MEANGLEKTLEKVLGHRSKQHELQDLERPNPKAKLAKLNKRRAIDSRSPFAQVPYITHNGICVNIPQEIADAFSDFFESVRVNDNNPATTC